MIGLNFVGEDHKDHIVSDSVGLAGQFGDNESRYGSLAATGTYPLDAGAYIIQICPAAHRKRVR